jgi:REP element-mobilizing transposase RayT
MLVNKRLVIREKQHRLPREHYIGEISIVLTMCIKDKVCLFSDTEVISVFTNILGNVVENNRCIIPVYCFMPDHQHMIMTGTHEDADLIKIVTVYKQKTGFWMSKNRIGIRWQKDFYDHIIKKNEDLSTQVRYILDNPVRMGLVSHWHEYRHKGSIGCDLDDILNQIV